MLKGFLRFLAGVLLLVAAIAATNDVTRSLAAGHAVAPVSALEHWSQLAPVSLDLARNAVQDRIHPLAWDLVAAKALQLPAWALLGLVAMFLAWLGRRRREINVFAN